MKKFLLTTAIALFIPLAASAQEMTPYTEMPAGVYKLDKTHASLVWKVSHMGLSNYTARFTDFDAGLTFDPKDPTQSKLTVSVNPMSIRTDYPNVEKTDFDKELATGENWLNAGTYPHIEFVSKSIEMTGDKSGQVTGDLTFMGVTKPVTLNVTFNGSYEHKPLSNTPALGFSAEATLKRSEWGLNTYIPMIGDDVHLLIETEFHKEG
ncbi:MAG: polyisoprenoid-binding protein [Rhodospirillales bacterium]|nr:polyisoprenoid-binding protein [Rhodospirillales bacterium]MCB9979847.1 polyisoprenoid-binding protein [Rhodospirillales bacterium]